MILPPANGILLKRSIHRAILFAVAAGMALPLGGGVFGQQGREDSGGRPFVIKVVDGETDRGVPLVKLETINHRIYYTDSMGVVAFDEQGLMGKKVFFHISSHGYEFPADGFKFRGKALEVAAGGNATLKIKRLNIAERLYRITGEGIYAESAKAGLETPVKHPLLNSGVLGSDSILSAVYHDRIFWVWGDTNQAAYPLGNFLVTAATSALPGKGGLDPSVGINLDYFSDGKGFTKKMAPLPGKGPTWLDALTTLTDKNGERRLVARYVKIEPPLTVYESGLCEYDPGKEIFEKKHTFPKNEKLIPHGHPFAHRVDGKDYIYCGNPFPEIRIPATYEAWADPTQYEAVETDVAFMDPETKEPLKTHAGSMAWNPYLKKWVAIFTQAGGVSSMLGEIWFATADAPEGPWRQAVKIVTHDHYSFYNPRHHPFLDQEGGKVIYFEGTYTKSFSASPVATPRYDYNQIMYRLDLGDPRLAMGGQ
jgi:hypothetical protein